MHEFLKSRAAVPRYGILAFAIGVIVLGLLCALSRPACSAEGPVRLPVGATADDYHSFVAGVQAPTLYLTYIDSRLPVTDWVKSAQYAAGEFKSSPWANAIPVVGLPMAGPGESAAETFRKLGSGEYDGIIRGVIQAFLDQGFTGFYLRPGFESSGNWFAWSVTPGNVAAFNKAFQRIAEIAHSYPNTLIGVVWNPNIGRSAVDMEAQYPGDAAVDVVALDLYGAPLNNDTAATDAANAYTFTLAGTMAFAKQHNKAFAIPEAGGANAAFVANLTEGLAMVDGVTIAFINVWDSDGACGGCAFPAGSDRAAAWRKLIGQVERSMLISPTVASVLSLGSSGKTAVSRSPQAAPPGQAASKRESPIPQNDPELAAVKTQIAQLEQQRAASPGAVADQQKPNVVLDTSEAQARIDRLNRVLAAARADLAATAAKATPRQ